MFIYVEASRNNHKKAEQIDDCDDGVSVLWKKYLFFIRLTKFRRIRLVYGCRWSCSSIAKLAQILRKNSIQLIRILWQYYRILTKALALSIESKKTNLVVARKLRGMR